MDNKLLTLQELEETWWWRRDENRTELERMKLFGYVLAARNYELMRRSPGGGAFKQNYLKLNREDKTTTAIAWANPDDFPYRQIFDPLKPEAGWTNPHPPIQWNLRLSKRTLKNAFFDFIDQHRNLQKVFPGQPLKGKRNRPPTWDYIEFLDMKRNKIGNMGDSERGMASKAERLAVRYLDEFKHAQIKKDEIARNWVLHDLFDDFSETPDM